MINVLVVHEFPLMCNIISSVLEGEPDICVVNCCTEVSQALEIVHEKHVDVVLVSSRLPDQGAFRLTNLLMQSAPVSKSLILGITETRETVLEYIEAGATGYVLRESSLDDLLTTIRAVKNGKALVSPEIAAALIQRVSEFSQAFSQSGTVPLDSYDLTPREIEVLELLGQNLSNQEIAQRLVIEMGTVKNHVHSILNKLGINRREEAARLAPVIGNKLKTEKI